MRAYVIHGPNDLRLDDVSEPTLGPNDVRLALAYGGICGSDLHYYLDGRAGRSVLADPMVLGHELSARVVETGADVSGLTPGQPVAVNPAAPCRACRMCRAGRENLCFSMRYLGSAAHRPHTQGGLAERFVVAADQLVAVPLEADLARAALAEPFAVALHAVNRADVAGKRVLVTGAGTIGVLVAIAADRAGAAEICVADIAPAALARMQDLLAVSVLDPRDTEGVARHAADPAFDVAIEAAGASAALNMSLSLVEPGSRVVQVGLMGAEGADLNLLVAREINLVGSFRFVDEFPDAVAAVLEDERLARVITARHGFGETDAAFAAAADKSRHLKVMIEAGA